MESRLAKRGEEGGRINSSIVDKDSSEDVTQSASGELLPSITASNNNQESGEMDHQEEECQALWRANESAEITPKTVQR